MVSERGLLISRIYKVLFVEDRRNQEKFETGTIFVIFLQASFQTAISPLLTVGSGWNFYLSFSTYQGRVPPEGSSIWASNKKIKIVENCCRERYNFSNFRVFMDFCRFYSSWKLITRLFWSFVHDGRKIHASILYLCSILVSLGF